MGNDVLIVEYTVYILRTSGDTFYTGITNNLEKRLDDHRNKTAKSAKYMRGFRSFDLIYTENCESKSVALKREYQIKQMTRLQKEKLISSSG